MKILYFNPDRGVPVLGDKGASVHVRSFVTAAARLGHEVVLACTTAGSGNPPPPGRLIELPARTDDARLRAEAMVRGLPGTAIDDPVVRRELARLAHDRGVRLALIAQLRRIGFQPDLVYERHALFSRAGVRIATHFGVPRLLEVNAPLIEEQARFRDLRLIDVARRAQAASYRRANVVIAVSEAVAQHVAGVRGNAAHVHVLPNGADLSRYRAGGDGAALRARLGIGAAPVIGFIGSFKPWHGVDFLFDVFAALARGRPDARLIAVGDGPDLAALRARAELPDCAGRIILPGRVPHDDIADWLAVMDVTVAPYHDQQDFYFSPLKIVESLAAGRPVVAPGIGQIASLIAPEVTGILYPPGDAAACEAALHTLIDQPARRLRMGEAARRAAAVWDWTAVVARALALAPLRQRELVQ
jgi:glycosyltransferase involved in cell wall biosynthesis